MSNKKFGVLLRNNHCHDDNEARIVFANNEENARNEAEKMLLGKPRFSISYIMPIKDFRKHFGKII